MERTMTGDLAGHAGEQVRLAGWVHHQRHLAQVSFLLLRDASGIAQVVIDDASQRAFATTLLPETVVEIEGAVVAIATGTRRVRGAPTGDHRARRADGDAAVRAAPARAARVSCPRCSTTPPWRCAIRAIRAAFSISAASLAGFRSTLDAMGFTEIQTPKIVGAATESGANVFELDYFGRRAYLAQSPQLYKQMMVGVFERVYETGPVFRAEPHDTARHLAEYVSLDAELGFIRDHRDVEIVLRDGARRHGRSHRGARRRRGGAARARASSCPRRDPPHPFRRRVAAHRGRDRRARRRASPTSRLPTSDGSASTRSREHGSDFLFVEGYPMAKRPFYTHPEPGRPEFSNSFDLLFRGLELVTGGQRLHHYDDYVAVMDAPARVALDGYLDAFRHGMPPHGGFAIGLERWTARLVGVPNVRQVTLFPRDINRLSP